MNGNSDVIIAIVNIEPGEELTLDYNFIETEPSLSFGMECKCGSPKCLKILYFDRYRDIDFQNQYFHFMTEFVQQRVKELRSHWYSGKCYTRSMHFDVARRLYTRVPIREGEKVACFSYEIAPKNHFIRPVEDDELPTAVLKENGDVIAICNMPAETEITLDFP